MDPVNKLYCFDWMILINTEYVVYSMCVCVLTFMWIEYIYILVHKVPVFIPPPPFLLLISRITIIQITIYVVPIVSSYNPLNFSRILKKISSPFHFISYSSYYMLRFILFSILFIIMFSMVLLNLLNKIIPIKKNIITDLWGRIWTL